MTETKLRAPAAPDFGAPAPPRASADTLALLATRRSSSAQGLGAPGPSREELADLLRLGARVPDHGKLNPWRFVIIEGAAKADLVRRFEALAATRDDADSARAKLMKLAAAPLTILVVSRVDPHNQIPAWEQELSSGAVCMNMLTAAAAMGYGANWITDWYAFDGKALKILGLTVGERVAGFIHVGTPAETPLERVRPDLEHLTSYWAG